MQPADQDTIGFVDSIREVVDCIESADQEATLNKFLGKGNNWSEDGTYIKNNDAIQIAYGEYIGGDCFLKSFECYLRLRSAGAKRFCGRRTAIAGVDTDDNPHYWVENKGMVFDCGGGQQKIYKTEKFYELMGIQGEREGNDVGCFRKDQYEVLLEEKSRVILAEHGVKALADWVRETNWLDNMTAFARIKNSKQNKPKFVKKTVSVR
jgi:hypothetical protein